MRTVWIGEKKTRKEIDDNQVNQTDTNSGSRRKGMQRPEIN
jgi:hypothetical protein